MAENILIGLVFAAVFIPIILFSIIAVWSSSHPSHGDNADEFLLAGRNVRSGDFINSSTAYMLQVSTTFYLGIIPLTQVSCIA